MDLLSTLVLAHLFADFPLQTDALARYKRRSLYGVLLHVLIYIFVTGLLIANPLKSWPLLLGLGAVHFVIDAAKSYLCHYFREGTVFIIDQCLHFFSMIVAALLAHWYWQSPPVGLVPQKWLPYALVAALLPALTVAYWIWDKSHSHHIRRHHLLNHFYRRALVIEQRFGLAVLGLVLFLLACS